MMTGSVQVNPDGLAELAARLADLAEQVRGSGHELTGVGSPDLGAY